MSIVRNRTADEVRAQVAGTLRALKACPQTVSIYLSRYLHGLGIDHTAHTLRHWFGTQLYRQTRDIRCTQEYLGHASVATTQVYTAFSPGPAAAVVRRLDVRLVTTDG